MQFFCCYSRRLIAVLVEVQAVIPSWLVWRDSTKMCRNGTIHTTRYILRSVRVSELFGTDKYGAVFFLVVSDNGMKE